MVKEEPKITILLAAYNREDLIKETLDSISSQTYSNWECFVTDDGSTDKTPDIIKEFVRKDNRFSYYLKPDSYPSGLSGTRNFGLDLARERGAEYIQFFDDDDLMYPQKLSLQIKPFIKNPELYFTVCKYDKLLEMKEGESIKQHPEFDMDFEHLGDAMLSNEFRMNSLGPLWNMHFIDKFRFDERLRYAEEWELYIRIGYLFPDKKNYEVLDEYLFAYRKHPRTLTMGKDKSLEKRKSSSISRFVVFDNLYKNSLHTPLSIKYFTRTFAIHQNQSYLKKINEYIKQEHYSFKIKLIVKIVTSMAGLYYRIIGKVTKYIR